MKLFSEFRLTANQKSVNPHLWPSGRWLGTHNPASKEQRWFESSWMHRKERTIF
jgi:hypothetical protein